MKYSPLADRATYLAVPNAQGDTYTVEEQILRRQAIPVDAKWNVGYIPLSGHILRAAAVVARLNGEEVAKERGQPGLEFWRFINLTGEAGSGIYEDVIAKIA